MKNTLMFNRAEQGYAQGGAVNKPQGMEHTTSSSQDASTQPLTGSALKALVRGWIAGTAGLPGDLEGLARKGVNWSFGPGGVNVDEASALPTSDFYKDWLPGKQQGDEMINDIGSVFGGVGATKPVSLAKGALSRVAAAAPGPMAGSRAAMRGVIKAPGGKWVNENAVEAANNMAEKAAKIEALGAGYLQSLPSDLQRALREHVLSPVNGILRSSNRARAEALDEAFYNAPELPKGVVLYRGENAAGPLKKAAVGGDRFPLYLPTSLSKEKALQFKKFAPDGVGSFNDITPTGDRQFLTPFNFASEQEVILPRSGIVKKLPTKAGSDASYSYDAMYADGGSVNKPQGMEHTRSEGQDATTQPLTGSALKALVRGWIAGTAGLPGDLEGLARTVDKYTTLNPAIRQLKDTTPVLPTADFYKEWLPGKQQGDEVIGDIGSLFGGVGATKPVALGRGALSRIAAATPAPRAGSMAAQRGVIKAPGGNWLSGSVEDALKGLKQGKHAFTDPYTPEQVAEMEQYFMANPGKPGSTLNLMGAAELMDAKKKLALNNFVDKQLTRYVQKDMATERDPIRALAERGVLHYAPQDSIAGEALRAKRKSAGFPESGMAGTSDLAQTWEALSDKFIDPAKAGELTSGHGQGGPFLSQNPWLTKLAPDTPVYKLGATARSQDLGFDHLMDELRNAVNINSGLPAHLRLDPESLARVSVPQAVERVAKINDWRAAQKVAADQARANNAATVLHKDYPDKGFKWMELKSGDLPEGWSQRKDALGVDIVYGPDGYSTNAGSIKDPRMVALRDSLKYEGDTMGHCVGGYCDEVASGKSRIYSLRDAKGQPHTTIEVEPDIRPRESFEGEPTPRIVQIKGKGNKAPNPEYLPYVQDFVKSGKWSDVGDLRNTGLVKHPSGYLTQEELQALGQAPQGFADGGSVRNALNAAVGGSGLVKAVGNTERAVSNIASGNASLGDLKSLRDMASQLGYTVPGLSQALGIAGVAKAGYNMVSDPSGMNAAKLAATVNPIAAQTLGLYQAATDPTPGTFVDAVSSFNPIARAYNGLANSFNFATIGQVMANLGKIADPNAPAQLRDMFSNNPNSAATAREANEMATRLGIDPMDAMMRVLNADVAAVPGPTVTDAINAYNQAQALQTNPSLNPASPDFMGPQADGGGGGGGGGDGGVNAGMGYGQGFGGAGWGGTTTGGY